MRLHFTTLILVSTLIAIFMMTSSVEANVSEKILNSPKKQDAFIREKIREHVGVDPLLEIIAGCESTGDPHLIKH